MPSPEELTNVVTVQEGVWKVACKMALLSVVVVVQVNHVNHLSTWNK